MKALLRGSTIIAGLGLAATMNHAALGLEFTTTLTAQGHTVAAGASAQNLEGAVCPTQATMVSGSCHPGYNDHVTIINQFPNIASNTWRCGFKNNTSSSVPVWIYTLCARADAVTTNVQHRLQVRRFSTSSLTNAEADSIMAAASTILQTNDGAGDTACAAAMSREGNVTVFSDGDGSIDSEAEFNALMALPGWVMVVNQINWCGALIPNVIGCAPVPGNSLAVVRFTPNLEGHLWAHEFGHNKGLSHRNDDANAVMNGVIGDTRRRITAAECNAYKAPSAALLAAMGAPQPGILPQGASDAPKTVQATAPAPQTGATAPGTAAPAMNVRDFVRQVFIHGVPYEEANKYDASAVPTLLEMLRDPAEQAFWPNIVVVLGMIGDQRAVDPLIAFVEASAPEGRLSREHYAAKTSALMALGYLVNKSRNRKALDYLKASVMPTTWAAKDISGTAPFQSSLSERNRDFSKFAILGLALTGHPEAAQTLRQLQAPSTSAATREFQTQVGDVITEALRENQKISEQGLMNYYRTHRR